MMLAFEEWVDEQQKDTSHNVNYGGVKPITDFATAEWLTPIVSGWMPAPTAIVGTDNVIVAASKMFDTLQDILDHLTEHSNTADVYLYKVYFFPSIPMLKMVDPESFSLIEFDTPKMSKPTWMVRFGTCKNPHKEVLARNAAITKEAEANWHGQDKNQ